MLLIEKEIIRIDQLRGDKGGYDFREAVQFLPHSTFLESFQIMNNDSRSPQAGETYLCHFLSNTSLIVLAISRITIGFIT